MVIINVTTFLNVPQLQKDWPGFKSVNDCDRNKIVPEMEVRVRSIGEYITIKIEDVDGDILIGKVLTKNFSFDQPFNYLDFVKFNKNNVIDIYDIHGWGTLL